MKFAYIKTQLLPQQMSDFRAIKLCFDFLTEQDILKRMINLNTVRARDLRLISYVIPEGIHGGMCLHIWSWQSMPGLMYPSLTSSWQRCHFLLECKPHGMGVYTFTRIFLLPQRSDPLRIWANRSEECVVLLNQTKNQTESYECMQTIICVVLSDEKNPY